MSNMATSAEEQNEEQVPQQAEMPSKVFKEDEVDRIKQDTARKSFQTGYEKAKAELSRQAQDQQIASPEVPIQPQTQNEESYSAQQTPDVSALIQQEFERRENDRQQQLMQQQGEQVLQQIIAKADAAKQEIPDYDEVTSQVNWQKHPDILGLANEFDNGGHILYHFAKNPIHIGALKQLISNDPDIAMSEARRVSQAMKINQDAPNAQMPNEPLGRMQTSTAGVGGSKPSMQDLRKKWTV